MAPSAHSLSFWNFICLFCLFHLCLPLMSKSIMYIQRESTLPILWSSFGIYRENLLGLFYSFCIFWIEKFSFLVTLLTKFLCSRSPPPIQLPWGIRVKFGFSSVPIGLNSAHRFPPFLTSSKWPMKNIRRWVEDQLSLWIGKKSKTLNCLGTVCSVTKYYSMLVTADRF